MGALASGGVRVLHDALAHQVQAADPGAFDRVLERAQREVERRVRLYRGEGHPRRTLTGRITFVIDDGMTTGATMEAAVEALHALRPGWLVAAVPVAPHAVCQRLRHQVDELVCLLEPPDFLHDALGHRLDVCGRGAEAHANVASASLRPRLREADRNRIGLAELFTQDVAQ